MHTCAHITHSCTYPHANTRMPTHMHIHACSHTDFLSLLPSVNPTLLSRLPCLLCSCSVGLMHNVFVWCLPPSHDAPTNMAVSAPTLSLLTLLLSGTLGISAPYQVHLSTWLHRLEMHRNTVFCTSTCSHFSTETVVSRVLMPFS